jgi:hypothetical protein
VVRIHSGVPHSKELIAPPQNGEYTTGTQQAAVRELSVCGPLRWQPPSLRTESPNGVG